MSGARFQFQNGMEQQAHFSIPPSLYLSKTSPKGSFISQYKSDATSETNPEVFNKSSETMLQIGKWKKHIVPAAISMKALGWFSKESVTDQGEWN